LRIGNHHKADVWVGLAITPNHDAISLSNAKNVKAFVEMTLIKRVFRHRVGLLIILYDVDFPAEILRYRALNVRKCNLRIYIYDVKRS